MINLERDGDVFIMTMDAGENRWNTNFARAFDARLDEALASEGPAALVTRSSDPKFFSNGLDLVLLNHDGLVQIFERPHRDRLVIFLRDQTGMNDTVGNDQFAL